MRLLENTNIKLAYSKRIERTTTFKMNPFPEREHSETLEQGDPNLHPELIDQVEVDLISRIIMVTVFSQTYIGRNVNNLINRVNTIYNDTILESNISLSEMQRLLAENLRLERIYCSQKN